MNQHLQNILNTINGNKNLAEEEKNAILKSLKDVDKALEQKRKFIEAQNKELEIESSLERVRTVALSMNTREDMMLVCRMISGQLELLNVKEIRNVQTAIFYEEKGTYMNYEYYTKHDKTFITETVYTNHEIAKAFAEKMLKGRGEEYITVITGAEKVKEWIAYQKSTNVFIDTFLATASSLNYYWFSLGPVALGISTYAALSDDELELFKRFLNVFELAYRRYLDIEKATMQAREAQVETALERVRSRSMSMQKSEELHEVIVVITEQLQQLGFHFDTATFITNYSDRGFDWCISTPGVKVPAALYCPASPGFYYFNLLGELIKSETGFYSHIFSFKEKNEFFDYVFENTLLKYAPEERKQYVYNSKGLAASSVITKNEVFSIANYQMVPYTEEENAIIKRIGKVFEQSYTRFLDLQRAEMHAVKAAEDLIKLQTEKKRAEDALTELRATQAQLIQSEKMASLGELTAGIAHEIQNPLNFVNNFSEVSNELIAEMNIEIEKGNIEEAKSIAGDLQQNLEKINHHGKRADAIVKGMLQHSRSSSAVKEPTNINKLADEYLRLAYHGLRAKDKFFKVILNKILMKAPATSMSFRSI